MKRITFLITALLTLACPAFVMAGKPATPASKSDTTLFAASNPLIQYTGRIDFSDPASPKFWTPGVYVKARFQGSFCEVLIEDEVQYGSNHNYIAIQVDGQKPVRMKLTAKVNVISAGTNLSEGAHTITICKNTETNIGYLQFKGIRCKALLPLPAKPLRRIEFIGNSITCGAGSDTSVIACDKGAWYDRHNAFMSYGPVTARALQAQWHLTSYSGIGLIHSCCDLKITMPQIFDKVNMQADSIPWNFSKYVPDVVTITLGENDGVQDSIKFCSAYVSFLQQLRMHYPKAQLVCLTSPMADERLLAALKNYILGVVKYQRGAGDKKVSYYFYAKRYHGGCGEHPSLAEHQLIAGELTGYLKKLMHW